MTPTDTSHATAVTLLGATYAIDPDDPVHDAFARAARAVDSARQRLEAQLLRVKRDADHALRLLRDGLRVTDPLHGPPVSDGRAAACAAEYDTVAAHAHDLLRLARPRSDETPAPSREGAPP